MTAPAPRPKAVPTVQVDNPRFIVTEWRFAPGAETGWHRHDHVVMAVPQTGGVLLLETPEGLREAPLVAGRSYSREAGVEHNVINGSTHEVVFIEIEAR